MEWKEEKVYLFKFTTDAGDVQFPVRAQTKEEAADTMQRMLSRIQTEIAMEFPKVSKGEILVPNELAYDAHKVLGVSPIPPEVLEMRMDTLLADLGASQLKGKAKQDTVKKWTGFDLSEENYPKIINELELIKTGQKEIEPNGKK